MVFWASLNSNAAITGMAAVAAVPFCLPPKVPVAPPSDSYIVEYADLIRADYEQYFKDLSSFTTCLEEARHSVVTEGQEVGEAYRSFLERASQLGVGAMAADIDPSATAGSEMAE